jgi:hypothetical protein
LSVANYWRHALEIMPARVGKAQRSGRAAEHGRTKVLLESSSPERGKRIGDGGWTNAVNAMPSQHVALLAYEILTLIAPRARHPMSLVGQPEKSCH